MQSTARAYIALTHENELPAIAQYLEQYSRPFFVLGGGSNILLPEVYSGLVIHNQLHGINIADEQADTILLRVSAGEIWDDFVAHTLTNGWFGLENLSLIPGTVGASPIQNIGAYGVEVKDFIESVEVYDIQLQQFKIIDKTTCNFSYRNSMFKTKHEYIVTAVNFRLLKNASLNTKYGDLAAGLAGIMHPTALDLRQVVIGIRSNKLPDPKLIANVGSFFHNPVLDNIQVGILLNKYPKLPVYAVDDGHSKVSAGWLIDNLGLKGYCLGNMRVYSKQALVLVNCASATKTEALNFAAIIQDKVWQEYQVKINIEPIVV